MGYRKRKRSCGNQSDRKTWSSLEDVDDGMVVWVLMIRQSRVELNRKGVQGNGCTEWEQSSSSVAWCTEVAAVGCVLRGAWCTDQGMKSGKKPGGNLERFMWFREIAVAASGDTVEMSRVELNRKGVQGNGCTEWEQSSSSVAWCTEVAAVGCVLRGAWCTDQGMKSGKKPGGNLEGFMWFREIAVAASGDTVEMVMKLEGLMRGENWRNLA
ncbi:hypothetical protein F0562_019485 [Nyssa sinensis]|uniref:Uncharacterized protein n=2 Tax=Nyssa sinensis TaxID=561372 RepID=A0A5J5BPB7_9ASTE|nr:hypothetical protein F0562_019485 [Nyssa sinensis]